MVPSYLKRLVDEASSCFGWHKFVDFEVDTIVSDSLGGFVLGPLLMEKFGFIVENVVVKP